MRSLNSNSRPRSKVSIGRGNTHFVQLIRSRLAIFGAAAMVLAFPMTACSQSEVPQDRLAKSNRLSGKGKESSTNARNINGPDKVNFTLFVKIRPGFRNLQNVAEVYHEYRFQIDRSLIVWPPGEIKNDSVRAMTVGVMLPLSPSPNCQGMKPFLAAFGIDQPGIPQWFFDNIPNPNEGGWRSKNSSVPGYESFEAESNDYIWQRTDLFLAKDKSIAVKCHNYKNKSDDFCSTIIEIPMKGYSDIVMTSGYSPKSEGVNVSSFISHMKCINEQAPMLFKEIAN